MSRVTWLSPGDPSQRTGGFLYNARMVEGLRTIGVEVEVVVLEGPWPWPTSTDGHAEALSVIEDKSVVVADGLLWPGLPAPIRSSLCKRCTVWVVVHSLVDKEQLGVEELAQKEMAALCEAHGWFATSQRTADLISERLGTTVSSVVIPGTEPVLDGPVGDSTSLLSVGHLIPRKGHDRLLRALSEIKDRVWSLRVVGSPHRDSMHASALYALCDELGLSDRVEFVGECEEHALESEYRRAGLLVHCAHFEAYGMVLSEALSRGLPVVSTEAGALDGLCSEAVFVVDHENLAHGLCRWLDDGSFRERAREAVGSLRFPTWEEQVVSLRAVLGLADHAFSTEWLRLREPFDHAARSTNLVEGFQDAVQSGHPRILEIATGLGSGARFVDHHFGRSIDWRLLDHDGALLADLETEMQRRPALVFETIRHDLQDVEGLPSNVDGVTTQALLDLVSLDWLERFARWLGRTRVPLLAAISVDGRMSWTVPDEVDDLVKVAFRTHQTWDRGFGPSPGVQAVPVLSEMLESAGFSVQVEQTDWDISAESTDMMTFMIEGVSGAAIEAAQAIGAEPSAISMWRNRRMEQLGTIGMCVGHLDLLAIPSDR